MATPQVNVAMGVTGQEQVAAALRQLASELGKVRQEEQRTQEVTASLGTLFRGFITYELINRVREFGKEAFTSAVEIGKLSIITGVSAKTLSVMVSAASKLGIESQALGKGIVFLEANIQRLNQGNNRAAAAFGLLGLSAKSFNGLNTDEKVLKVVDAIGKMANGDAKAAAAKELLGKAGANLIPTLNMLAGDGYARVAEEAEKMGLIINDQTAQAAVAAAVAFKELGETAKGAATQFEGGFTPALADAADELVNAVGGDGAKGFETLGRYAGNVLKFLTEGIIELGILLKSVWTTQADVAVSSFQTIVNTGSGIFHALADAAHGDFAQAWQDMKNAAVATGDSWINTGKDIVNTWKQTSQKIKEIDKDLWDPARIAQRQKDRLKKLQASPSGEDANTPFSPLNDKTAKARLELLKAQAANELAIWKAMYDAESAEDKSAEDLGLITLTEYFSRRRAAVAEGAAREIATLEAEYKRVAAVPAANEQQRLQRQKELETIQAHIAVLEVKASQDQIELDRQEYDQKLALARQLQDYQAEILAAQGNIFDAAMVKIAQEADAIRINLAKAGLTPRQIDQVLGELQKAKVLAAGFDDARRQASLAQGASGLAVGNLDLGVERGDVLEVNRQRELSAIYAQELPQLREIAASMLEIAKLSGDPAKVLEAEQFAQSVEHIANQADYARQQWVEFKNTIANGIEQSIASFPQLIANAKSVGDAFEQLGLSISRVFEKAIFDAVAKKATQKLTGILHMDDTNGGTQVASAFSASSARMITAGTTISSAAVQLGAAAAQLQAAASTLAGAGGGGTGGGGFLGLTDLFGGSGGGSGATTDMPVFAGGGAVRGRGSSTSDSIPARLSDGEFVNSAPSVRHYGVGFFHSLNAMRFARGGHVNLAAVRAGASTPAIASYAGSFATADVAARASAPVGGDGVQRHVHEFPPELMHMTFAEGFQRLLARDWSRR